MEQANMTATTECLNTPLPTRTPSEAAAEAALRKIATYSAEYYARDVAGRALEEMHALRKGSAP